MVNMNSCLRMISLGTVLAMGGYLYAQDDTKPAKTADDTKPVKPDNSKMNSRNRTDSAKTADTTMTAADRDLAAKVRKAITDDKTLSTYAHNVKVIAHDGMVTLKGPVRSAEEKSSIEAKAAEVAGAGKVTNELTVAPKKDKSS
jgi:hyperosmotically inducible protein